MKNKSKKLLLALYLSSIFSSVSFATEEEKQSAVILIIATTKPWKISSVYKKYFQKIPISIHDCFLSWLVQTLQHRQT